MALFIAFLSFILSTTARDSGEYFPNYNQSYFGWSGSPKGYCTLTADYESGGRPYTNQAYSWQGCEKTELSYESQQAFDLTYWELLKVCPTLLKTPLSERGTVDWSKPAKGKGKYLLPDQLVWSTQCSSNDWTFNNDNQWDSNGLIAANMYCPRWKCDNSSALWDKDYNASFTYQEIIQLRFSSTPLTSSCWKCHCAYWPDGKDWVWTCDGSYANYPDGGNGGEAGKGWSENTLNPIDNIFTYPTRKCMEATPGPTPQPSDGTPNPTPSPSVPPTNDNTCTSVWNAVNEQWKIRPGEDY
eukprot:290881_1